MIDCFAFLSGHQGFDFFTDYMDSSCIESKRLGYKEFTGTLYGRTADGGTLSLTSYPQGKVPFIIDISTDVLRYVICELDGKAWISEQVHNWNWEVIDFSMPYQSQLTHLAVQAILDERTCDLTSYEEACILHVPMIKAFMKHMQHFMQEEVSVCPIT